MTGDDLDFDYGQLADYLDGTASRATHAAVEAWLHAKPERQAWVAQVQHAREQLRATGQAEIDRVPLDTIYAGVLARVQPSQRSGRASDVRSAPTSASRSSFVRRWGMGSLVAATAMVGVLAVGVTSYLWPRTHVTPPATEHVTQRGELARIRLPDGSTVLLGPESRMRYTAATFRRSARDVVLEGQALFTVVNNGYPPFVVHTRGVAARVLGTTFVVRGYADDPAVRVVVAEGKVAVAPRSDGRAATPPSVVTTGGAVRVVRDGRELVQEHEVNLTAALGWSTRRFDFRDTPLAQVLTELGRAYGVDVHFQDPALGRRQVTLSIDAMPVDTVLSMLAGISHTTMTRTDHLVTVRNRP